MPIGLLDSKAKKVEHDLGESLVAAVCVVLSGADTFAEMGLFREEKLSWLRKYLRLAHGIACDDIFGRVFAAIDPEEFGAAFVRWVDQTGVR